MTRILQKPLGVLGGIPLGEWGAPKSYPIEGRGKSFPLMIVTLLFTICLQAEVICIWDGNGYTCSGSGTQVNVIGGGELAPVVTNGVGVCTNCASISPDQLCALADQIETQAGYIKQATDNVMDKASGVQSLIDEQRDEISTYRTFGYRNVSGIIYNITNYAFNTDNAQAAAMRHAGAPASGGYDTNSISSAPMSMAIAGNAVYYYANNTVLPQLNQYYQDASDISGEAAIANSAAWSITDELLPELREGCTACQAGTGSGGGGSSGGTNSNGAVTGDWCTYDQGEAIKRLLSELSNYVARCEGRLLGISNNTAIIIQSIKDAFYSPYNAIPEYAGLGGQTWQDVYLQGADTPWGYEATNYLARIELLLYGISGVGTNNEAFAELTDQMEDTDSAIDNIRAQLGTLRSDASGQQAQTLGQAIVNLFDAFTPTASELSSGTELMPSTTYSINGQEFEVPQIIAQGGAISTFNSIQSVTRAVATAIYGIAGAFAIFLYWRWFADKAIFFSKWAVELVSTLFYQ